MSNSLKLTKAQEKQVQLLKDGRWHNIHSTKGLKLNTLEALERKGIIKIEKRIDRTLYKEVFGKYTYHPDRDLYFKLIKD